MNLLAFKINNVQHECSACLLKYNKISKYYSSPWAICWCWTTSANHCSAVFTAVAEPVVFVCTIECPHSHTIWRRCWVTGSQARCGFTSAFQTFSSVASISVACFLKMLHIISSTHWSLSPDHRSQVSLICVPC